MTVNTNNGYHPTPDPDEIGDQTQTTFMLSNAELLRVQTLRAQLQARVGTRRKVARAEILREVVAAGLDVLERREVDIRHAEASAPDALGR